MNRVLLVMMVIVTMSGCSAPSIRETDETIFIPVHDRKWQIVMQRNNWKMNISRVHNNGTSHIYNLTDDKTKVSLTISINKAPPCKTSQECRQHWLRHTLRSYGRPYAVEHFDDDRFLTTRFMVLRNDGFTINQLNYASHAYMDGIWIFVRVSKIQAANDDARFMSSVARSMHITDL